MLGVYREGEPRKAFARKQLHLLSTSNRTGDPEDAELPPSAVIAKYRKMLDGFAPFDVFEIQNGFFGQLVEDFRIADWWYRHNPDKKFEENLNASDLSHFMDERKEMMEDFADSEAGSVWRFTHKKPVSIVVG